MAIYSAGSPLVWREVEGGELPSPRWGLRVAVVGNVLFASGGYDGRIELTSVLSWDPVNQTWQEAGRMSVGRALHAVVTVPSSMINCN